MCFGDEVALFSESWGIVRDAGDEVYMLVD